VTTVEELQQLDLDAICARQGPTLIEVLIDGEEVPPMGARMKTLERG